MELPRQGEEATRTPPLPRVLAKLTVRSPCVKTVETCHPAVWRTGQERQLGMAKSASPHPHLIFVVFYIFFFNGKQRVTSDIYFEITSADLKARGHQIDLEVGWHIFSDK